MIKFMIKPTKDIIKIWCIMTFCIINFFMFWQASKLSFSPNAWNLLMYCPQSIDIVMDNTDTPIAWLDMLLDFSWIQIGDIDFDIIDLDKYVLASLLSSETTAGERWTFAWTRKPDKIRQQSENPILWRFLFTNRYLQTITDVSFYGLANTTNWDSNLSYAWQDWLEIPAWLWQWHYNYITWTCTPDTKAPIFPISNMTFIRNWAYRVISWSNYTFRIIDDSNTSVQYRYPTPNFILTNYTGWWANAVDNQYGVNSWTIQVSIQWTTYSDVYLDGWTNNFSSILSTWITRHQKDKWYDIEINPIKPFNIEEEIIITIRWSDNTHISKPQSYEWLNTIVFNSPKSPEVIRDSLPDRSPATSTLVNPELEEIIFRVEDDRAGVNSWSLVINIFTWDVSWPVWVNPLKQYQYWDVWFSLSWVSKIFSSNNIIGSHSITHDLNYQITLTWFWRLPEDSYIWVVVSGEDFAYVPQGFSPNSFHFQTRISCSSLQCGDWVAIYTWQTNAFTIFTETWLTITWWKNPYLDWDLLYCAWPEYIPLSIYKNSTEISYWNSTWWISVLQNFTWWNFDIQIVWWTAKIVWNTLYITKTPIPPPPPPPSWEPPIKKSTRKKRSSWWSSRKDNCLQPFSRLKWSNRLWIDYSPSAYDQTCEAKEKVEIEKPHKAAPLCEIESEYGEEYQTAYLYSCKMWVTTMQNIEEADLDGIVIRKHLAKMLSEYAIKFHNKKPDNSRNCNFTDISNESAEMQKYVKLACSLGLMWLNSDWTPNTVFNPNGVVSVAEFGTTFSRLIYWTLYNTDDSKNRYVYHLKALKQDVLIDDISKPFDNAKRKQVMILIERSDKLRDQDLDFTLDWAWWICSLSVYGEELEIAYLYACWLWITTKTTIKKAEIYGPLLRKHLAKMVWVYATKVLKKEPDLTKDCNFWDTLQESEELSYRIKKSCQLWLMWRNYDGKTTLENFMPNDKVTRAQRSTIFSRLIRWQKNNWDQSCRYCPHIQDLKNNWIVNEIEWAEKRIELRWYVMLMMERARDSILK